MKRVGRMSMAALIAVIGGAAIARVACAQGEAPKEPGKGPALVNLDLQEIDTPEALAQIGKQTGWDVYVAKEVDSKVTLKADKVEGEKALNQVADLSKGSWLRFYLIEKPTDQRTQRAPDKMLEFLANEQRERIANMTDEERQQLFQRGGGGRGGGMFGGGAGGAGQGGQGAAPQGAPAQGAAPQGAPAQDMVEIDPLRFLRAAEFHDKVTVSLKDAVFLAVLDQFWQQSGYPVVTEENIEQNVSLEVKEEDLEKALDQFCKPLNLKWFRAYLVVKPEELTREEARQRMQQQMEQRWNQQWSDYWSKNPEERQQELQQRIDRLKNIPPDRLQRTQQSRRASRMIERYTNYMTKLTSDQRREIAPLVREIVRVFGGGAK